MSFQKEINRLAGTTGKEAQHAANVLAGTTNRELLYALNVIAGTAGRGFNHVMRLIAAANGGVGTQEGYIAFDDVAYGSVIVGGFDTVVRAFSQGFTSGAAYYDGGGISY